MSSINDGRENEFAYDESNIVGHLKTPEEKDKKYLNQSKRTDLRRKS